MFEEMAFQWRHVMRFWVKNGRQRYRTQINEYWSKSQTKGVKTKEIELSTIWLSRISIFYPHNFKNKFLGKNLSKIQNYQNYQKHNIPMRRIYKRVAVMSTFKSVSRWLTPNSCNKCEVWWRHAIYLHFWAIYRHRTQKQITQFDFWDETKYKGVLYSLNKKVFLFKSMNFSSGPFWVDLFLTWPSGQMLKLRLPLDSSSKITHITCVTRLSWNFPHDDLMGPDRDIDLYLR